MLLWRISRHLDLRGEGGRRASGRWNLAGAPVVYTSDSAACALLETTVHITAEDVPPTFTLLRIVGPEIVADEISPDDLPLKWMNEPGFTQQIGANWLESRHSALLRVPSVMVTETWNYLLNPMHPDAALLKIERAYEYPFDLRLKH